MAKHILRIKAFVIFLCSILLCSACDSPFYSQIQDQEEATEGDTTESSYSQATPESALRITPVEGVNCDYYVAPSGDDDQPGTVENPWASFQHAGEKAVAGETVCFRGGIYQTEDIHLFTSGKEDGYITFAAYPDEEPTLDGNGLANELLVLKRGVSHLRISGFRMINFRIWGIFLTGDNHHIILDHLDIEGGETSIRFTYGESSESAPLEGPVQNVLLEDSLIHGSQYSAVDCTPGPCNYFTIRRVEVLNTGLDGEAFFGSDGIEFARGHHIIVEDCIVHDNGGDGIDLGSRDREGHVEGVVVRRNRVFRNHLNGVKIWAGGRIENNFIWGQGNSAIWAGTFHSGIEIINNTVAYNMWDERYSTRNWVVVVGFPEALAKPEVNLTMVNNIFAFNATPLEGGPTSMFLGAGVHLVKEGNNLYYSREEEEIIIDIGDGVSFSRQDIVSGSWSSYSGQGNGNLIIDPLFISGWPEVDLRLQGSSPAIDAGFAPLAPEVDGGLKPRDEFPDIGAHEY